MMGKNSYSYGANKEDLDLKIGKHCKIISIRIILA
jgi:hypothetical protein